VGIGLVAKDQIADGLGAIERDGRVGTQAEGAEIAVLSVPCAIMPPCQLAELAQLPPLGLIQVPFWARAVFIWSNPARREDARTNACHFFHRSCLSWGIRCSC
jgi:hypothetical protein